MKRPRGTSSSSGAATRAPRLFNEAALLVRRERATELLLPPVGLDRAEAFLRRPEDGSRPDQLALALDDRPVSVRQLALLLL